MPPGLWSGDRPHGHPAKWSRLTSRSVSRFVCGGLLFIFSSHLVCVFSVNLADTLMSRKRKAVIARYGLGAGFLSQEKGIQLSPGSVWYLLRWEAKVRFEFIMGS